MNDTILGMKDNVFSETHPELAKGWHTTKNGSLSPEQFTASSEQSIWWQCPKHLDHVWLAKIRNRAIKGSGCHFCAGKLVSPSESLQDVYPQIAAEWHPIRNGELAPDQVRFGSAKSAWWQCSKGHEWKATITNRGFHKSGCPYCTNKKVGKDNCLAVTHPKLTKEWHPTKNGELTPYDVVAGSQRKVWWKCDREHEWVGVTLHRKNGHGCPYCSGLKVFPKDSLAATHPELVKEWHSTKNGELNPIEVGSGSGRKVWWQCRKGHEWKTTIQSRVGGYGRKGTNCSYCHPQISDAEYRLAAELKLIFPNLEQKKKIEGKEADIFIDEINLVIELDGSYFHQDKESFHRDRRKNSFFEKLGYSVLRLRGKKLNKISDHDLFFDCGNLKFEDVKRALERIIEMRGSFITQDMQEAINNYMKLDKFLNEEEYVSNRKALPGKFTLGNFKEICPDLVKEWCYESNGSLLPEHFSLKSGKKVYWQCRKGHKWRAPIARRADGVGCPYCSNKKVCEDNCLAIINSELAKEWHSTENGKLTPYDVVANSNKKVSWQCDKGHKWRASVDCRHREKTSCPFCINQKIDKTNCLATTNPELAAEWHSSRNKGLSIDSVSAGSKKKVWWLCKNDKTHEWEATIDSRNRGNKCPYCSGKKVDISNCLATVNPTLAAEWHPTKNGEFTPYDFTRGSKKIKIWWLCLQGHEYQALILTRSHNHGCPECARKVKSETAKKRWEKHRRSKIV